MCLVTGTSILAVAGGMAAAAAPASAASTPDRVKVPAHVSGAASTTSAPFELVNYNSLMCLGILNGGTHAPALQWGCNTHPDQQWHWGNTNPASTNYRQLVNGDDQCLGITSGSTAQDARAVGWTCLGSNNLDQYWSALPFVCGGGYRPLGNLKSGLVLGVSGNSLAQGATVVQFRYQNVCNNQFWLAAS